MVTLYPIGYILQIYLMGDAMEYLALTAQQLAQVLRGYRRSRRLTQQQAATLGGLLQKTVSSLEVAPQRTSVESLFKLLSALKLELVLRDKEAGTPKPPGRGR